jgi:hypothetical protein
MTIGMPMLAVNTDLLKQGLNARDLAFNFKNVAYGSRLCQNAGFK